MTLEQIMDSEFFTDTYTKIEKLKTLAGQVKKD